MEKWIVSNSIGPTHYSQGQDLTFGGGQTSSDQTCIIEVICAKPTSGTNFFVIHIWKYIVPEFKSSC